MNLAELILVLLGWITSCTVMGCVLHIITIDIQGMLENVKFSWNQLIDSNGIVTKFSHLDNSMASPCMNGGRALLTFAVFAFFIFLAKLTLSVIRVLDQLKKVPYIKSWKRHSVLLLELVLLITGEILIILMSIIWGATCYKKSKAAYALLYPGFSISSTATGYGMIVSSIFLTLSAIILFQFFIRSLELQVNDQNNSPTTGFNRPTSGSFSQSAEPALVSSAFTVGNSNNYSKDSGIGVISEGNDESAPYKSQNI